MDTNLPSGAPELLLCSSLPQQKIRPSWKGAKGCGRPSLKQQVGKNTNQTIKYNQQIIIWDLAPLTTELVINNLHHASSFFDMKAFWQAAMLRAQVWAAPHATWVNSMSGLSAWRCLGCQGISVWSQTNPTVINTRPSLKPDVWRQTYCKKHKKIEAGFILSFLPVGHNMY